MNMMDIYNLEKGNGFYTKMIPRDARNREIIKKYICSNENKIYFIDLLSLMYTVLNLSLFME